ncbi:MAG: RES family NAD+ phosphorylase [Cytophagales bacterium]|nr:RES family NAD+ phosphorylase [Cytophagales bacterium]
MIVYRIANPDYAHDLSGMGASLFGGRWNQNGLPLLYTAETSSLAILEFLVHVKGVKGNLKYKLLTVDLNSDDIENVNSLSKKWTEDVKLTQDIGTKWIKSQSSLGLRVPSVHNPLESNILVNPRHPTFAPKIERSDWYWYDGRLIQKT